MITNEAADRKLDIVMFGHTHRPCYEVQDGIVVLNPGSLSYPRQEGRRPSYMMMELNERGEAQFELRYVERDW